jgi:hypothetical protein
LLRSCCGYFFGPELDGKGLFPYFEALAAALNKFNFKFLLKSPVVVFLQHTRCHQIELAKIVQGEGANYMVSIPKVNVSG